MRYKLIGENDVFNVKDLVFKNRNIEDVDKFLNPTEDVVHDWKLLNNIKEGCKLLGKHLKEDNKIHILVDTDADGFTSFAVMFNYIKSIHPNAKVGYHTHPTKTHGIVLEQFEGKMDFDLLIVPDGGTNDHEEIKFMVDNGKDVLILDHHQGSISPLGCTINPQLDDYPNKQLSGSMVTYKFCKAMDEYLGVDNADDYLDLAVVGLIGDMMDTTVLENRYYIDRVLNQPLKNHFLQAIVDKQAYSINGDLTIKAIAFCVTPLINGLIRVGDMTDKMDMLRSFVDKEALTVYVDRNKKENVMPLYKDMPRRCTNLKSKQDRAKVKTVSFALDSDENVLYDGIISIVKVEDSNTKGVICADIASKKRKPVLVVSLKDGVYSGSARGYERHYVKELKPLLEVTLLFDLIEGHNNAFGVSITEKNMNELIEMLIRRFKDVDTSTEHNVDLVVGAKGVTKDLCNTFDSFKKYWGKGFPLPVIAVKDAKCNEFFLNEKVFKFECNGVSYVKFKPDVELFEQYQGKTVVFEVVGECGLNEYNGNVSPQVIMTDYNVKVQEEKEFVF